MRRVLAAGIGLLMFAACSAESQPSEGGNVISLPEDGEGGQDKSQGGSENAKSEKRRGTEKTESAATEKKEKGATGGNDRPRPSSETRAGEPSAARLTLPVAGSYSYAQNGWEELCQASNCDRSDLPPTQTVKISFEEKSASRAVFVSETRGSGSRTQTITYDVATGSRSYNEAG